MEDKITLETATEKFESKDYEGALQELETLLTESPDDVRLRACAIAAQALAGELIKGEDLSAAWAQVRELISPESGYELLEAVRQTMAPFIAAVYARCNDRQILEYASLQKDVNFDKKEYVLHEFQRILKEADTEYLAVLEVLYGYARIAAEAATQPDMPAAFAEGALGSMLQAARLQAKIGLEESFDPTELAVLACRMDLAEGAAWELRKELLDICLHGPRALEQWELFAPYAGPDKLHELEKEARKHERRGKIRNLFSRNKKQG